MVAMKLRKRVLRIIKGEKCDWPIVDNIIQGANKKQLILKNKSEVLNLDGLGLLGGFFSHLTPA